MNEATTELMNEAPRGKYPKVYTVISVHRDRRTPYTGTLEHLSTRVFGYTLECGHSWNNKIPLKPKTYRSLLKALNDSSRETMGGCYNPDYYLDPKDD